jgi:hypothetical protein
MNVGACVSEGRDGGAALLGKLDVVKAVVEGRMKHLEESEES